MARLVALGLLPVMADEALTGPTTAMDYARAGAADVFAVKIEQSGGLNAARAVAQIGAASGVGLYGGTMLEGSIGTIASAHVFATFPRWPGGRNCSGRCC
jgi:muconate cycloisomerase